MQQSRHHLKMKEKINYKQWQSKTNKIDYPQTPDALSLGWRNCGEKRIIGARWSHTKKLWFLDVSRTRSTLHHQETSKHIQLTKTAGNLGTTSARSLLHTSQGPRVTVRVLKMTRPMNREGRKAIVPTHYPSICHVLQFKFIAMSGMPIFIRETCYVPYLLKSGGQYTNLVPSCINAMCILDTRPKWTDGRYRNCVSEAMPKSDESVARGSG